MSGIWFFVFQRSILDDSMKRIIVYFLAVAVCICPLAVSWAKSDESWVVAIYLCGSDLESQNGFASFNLLQMVESKFSKNVKFVIETGGAIQWQNEVIEPSKAQRYEINADDMFLLEEVPGKNMGASRTLSDFITFVKKKYKDADHMMLIIWDHGGGSAGGFAFDENHNDDYLTLDELDDALETAFKATDDRKFDIIGFDACLMATLDVAMILEPYADYMIASQETEPGTGWNYTAIINSLSKNSGQNAQQLGKTVVDSYIQQCNENGDGDDATLSLVNLKKIPKLFYDYAMLGFEIAGSVTKNSSVLRTYGRAASSADSYGEGKYGMIDLSGFMQGLSAVAANSSQTVINDIRDAVVYRVNGRYHKGAGLSTFYPNASGTLFEEYMGLNVGVINPNAVVSALMLGGIDQSEGNSILPRLYTFYQENKNYFLDQASYTAAAGQTKPENEVKPEVEVKPDGLQPAPAPAAPQLTASSSVHTINAVQHSVVIGTSSDTQIGGPLGTMQNVNEITTLISKKIDISKLEDHDIEFDSDNTLTVKLTRDELDLVDEVNFVLFYYDDKDDKIIMDLGSDANVDVDWEKGIIKDNFGRNWPAIDGHLLRAEVVYTGEDYLRYESPIKLNGRRMDLLFAYDFSDEKYHITGVREVSGDSNGSKRTIQLRPGDTVTTIMEASSLATDNDDWIEADVDTFKVTEKTRIEDEDLGDGTLRYMFKFIAADGNSATSKIVEIEMEGDTMNQTILD